MKLKPSRSQRLLAPLPRLPKPLTTLTGAIILFVCCRCGNEPKKPTLKLFSKFPDSSTLLVGSGGLGFCSNLTLVRLNLICLLAISSQGHFFALCSLPSLPVIYLPPPPSKTVISNLSFREFASFASASLCLVCSALPWAIAVAVDPRWQCLG